MIPKSAKILLVWLACLGGQPSEAKILDEALAYWNFRGLSDGEFMISAGKHQLRLRSSDELVKRTQINARKGITVLTTSADRWYYIPRNEIGALNLGGPGAQVTLAAWVCGVGGSPTYLAGVWSETDNTRQYALFMNLTIHDSAGQLGGHISATGGPSAGFKYAMDAAIGATKLKNEWTFVAMTYDGKQICAYVGGKLDRRVGMNPYPFSDGIYKPSTGGADFTVGANNVEGVMRSHFIGHFGFLAVYDRALTERELTALGRESRPHGVAWK